MACPPPSRLAETASDPASAPEVLDHAADCLPCRDALMDLGDLETLPVGARGERATLSMVSRRPAWRIWAPAAAVLLLAAGLLLRDDGPQPEARPAPTSVPAPRFPSAQGLVEASDGDLSVVLGQAGALTLRAGSRCEVRGASVALLEGALWLEDPGEALLLKAGDIEIQVQAATLLLERTIVRQAGLLLRTSWAEESEGRLLLLSGTARVGAVEVRAGQELRLGSSAPMPAGPLAWRGDGGWERLSGLPRRLPEGQHVLAPALEGGYVWEALCRRADPAAGAAVLFGDGERGWQVPLGVPWAGEGAPLRIRVEVRGGWVRLVAGPYEILRKPLGDLDALDPAPPRCGLQVWGGEIEALESRWRALP